MGNGNILHGQKNDLSAAGILTGATDVQHAFVAAGIAQHGAQRRHVVAALELQFLQQHRLAIGRIAQRKARLVGLADEFGVLGASQLRRRGIGKEDLPAVVDADHGDIDAAKGGVDQVELVAQAARGNRIPRQPATQCARAAQAGEPEYGNRLAAVGRPPCQGGATGEQNGERSQGAPGEVQGLSLRHLIPRLPCARELRQSSAKPRCRPVRRPRCGQTGR